MTSDTNYPNLGQISQIKSTGGRLSSLQIAVKSLKILTLTSLRSNWLQIWGFHYPLRSEEFQKWPTESGKQYTYSYSFITKDINQNQPKGEMYRVSSGRVPNAKLRLSPGTCYPLCTLMCDYMQRIASQENWCPEFLLGFSHVLPL